MVDGLACSIFQSLSDGISGLLEVLYLIFMPLLVIGGVLHLVGYHSDQPLERRSEHVKPALCLLHSSGAVMMQVRLMACTFLALLWLAPASLVTHLSNSGVQVFSRVK